MIFYVFSQFNRRLISLIKHSLLSDKKKYTTLLQSMRNFIQHKINFLLITNCKHKNQRVSEITAKTKKAQE